MIAKETIPVEFIKENKGLICSIINKYTKYYEFTFGIFNLSSVLFFVSTAVIFNFLTIRIFEKRRWS